MSAKKEPILRDLVAKADRADRADRQRRPLAEALHTRLITELEASLVNVDRLRRYLGVLQEVLNDHVRYDDAACLEDKRRLRPIEERGLAALEEMDLTRLALNPVVLCALSDHIAESVFTDYWTDVSARTYADQVGSPDRGTRTDGRQPVDSPDGGSAYPPGSWANLVDLGLPALRAAVAASAHTKVIGSALLPGTGARVQEPKQSEQRDKPRFRVAACAAESDLAVTDAVKGTESKLTTLAEFTWQGQQCKLIADMDDASVFAAAPTDATNLVVGRDKSFRLVECEHDGLRRVVGITRPRVRRHIEAGDAIGFLTSNRIQDHK